MGRSDDDLKARLLIESGDFRRLHEQHKGCDTRLEELSRKAFLSSDEQLEERTLKKRKLLLKDQMEAIKVRYAEGHAT